MKIDKDKLPQRNVTKISVEIIYNIESSNYNYMFRSDPASVTSKICTSKYFSDLN